MDHHPPSPTTQSQPYKIPVVVWVLAAGLILALVAVFVFNVSWSTVGYYALIAFFIGSHFFMHGSHGGHGSRAGHGQDQAVQSNVDGRASAAQPQSKKDEHTGHSGCCH